MAVPNYTYLKLKMPGPNGVITVGNTYKHAFECDVECVEYAEALAESEALIADLESLSKEVPDVKRHAGNFEPAETVKSVPLDPNSSDPTGALDHVLRRVADEDRSQRRPALHLASREAPTLRATPSFPGVQQCG
jgi:hypothetical protein